MPSATTPTRVQGSERGIQESQSRRTSAAMEKAAGIPRDANPRNMIGGWIVIHGSWRSGLSPFPSGGMVSKVSNGLRFTSMSMRNRVIPM